MFFHECLHDKVQETSGNLPQRKKKEQTSATIWAPKQAPKWTSGLELSNSSTHSITHSREKKSFVLVSVKSGAEVAVEVSLFFFYCNAVLGLGLGSGLRLALTLTLNNPNLILTLTLTLKQYSLKKDRPRPRPRVLRALAWYSQPFLNGHLSKADTWCWSLPFPDILLWLYTL